MQTPALITENPLISIVKLILATLSLIDARVTTLQGATANGILQGVDARVVMINGHAGEVSLSRKDVLEIQFSSAVPDEIQLSPQEILLHDGSVLATTETVVSAGAVTTRSPHLGNLKIPRTAVRAVRLHEMKTEWSAQWQSLLKRANERDLLVVFKRDGSGLDFLTGTIAGVRAEDVPFILDGDEIPVPRARVFGIVLAAAETLPVSLDGTIALSMTTGDQLHLQSVEYVSSQFNGTTSWGQSVLLPVDAVRTIDFSAGRIHFLSDLEPVTERYFGLDPPGKEWGDLFAADMSTRTGLSGQWKMSRDSFANNGQPPLTLRGKSYRKGLCIFPRASIEYALDGKYTKLMADVGVDDDVAFNQRRGQPATAVELLVQLDGRQVFQKLISAPSAVLPLELDVTGVSTLSLTVDFGDGSSTCDYLDLADAKLIVAASAE